MSPPVENDPRETAPQERGSVVRSVMSPSTEGIPPAEMEVERHRLKIKLTAFEGPLDLLLHLVRSHEVDIHDIPIIEIARQYDAHLSMMQNLDLDVAGEFLVMAATLAYIKSRMLLPLPKSEDGEEEDPRAELTERLLEHERFLLVAEELSARSDVQDSVWVRPVQQRVDMDGEILLEVSVLDLVRSYRGLLDAISVTGGMEIEPDGISVHDRMAQVMELVEGEELIDGRILFPPNSRKRDRIITFLALLELLRLQMISAWQTKTFGEIRLSRAAARPAGPHPTEGLAP